MPDRVDALIEDWEREIPDLDTSGIAIVGRVLLLGRIFEQSINTKLKPFGLIYTDFDLLATLRRSGGDYCLTPTELRQSVLLTSGAMTAALDRLEGMGLISRVRSKEDRRSMSAKLTPAGRALLEQLLPLRFEDAKANIDSLSAGQITSASSALRRILLSLETKNGDAGQGPKAASG